MIGLCSNHNIGASSWGLLLGLLASRTNAFVPATIRWVGTPTERLILTHGGLLNTASGPQQQLIIADKFHRASREDAPHFTIKSDKSIAWDAWKLCIEAGSRDRKHQDAVGLSQCTGSPNQKWDWLPWAPGRAMIRLSGTSNECLVVDDKAAGSFSGALVVLRECKDEARAMWNMEEPLFVPRNGSSQPLASSLSLLHGLISLIVLAVLGASSLSAWLWWCPRKRSTVAPSQGCIPWNNQGGISLVAPEALCQSVVIPTPLIAARMEAKVPAAMALSTMPGLDVDVGKHVDTEGIKDEITRRWVAEVGELISVLGPEPLACQNCEMFYLPTDRLPNLGQRSNIVNIELAERVRRLNPNLPVDGTHYFDVVKALLFYATGALDEAHNLVLPLSWPSPTHMGGAPIQNSKAAQDAALVHAMLHRQEGDFVGQEGGGMVGWDNARFWFSQAGKHPLYVRILQAARELAKGKPVLEKHLSSHGASWSAARFLGLCQDAVRSNNQEALEFCRFVANLEWRLLLEHCWAYVRSLVQSEAWRPRVSSVIMRQSMPDAVIVLDPFAARNFVEPGKEPEGRAFIMYDKAEFTSRVNSYYLERVAAGEDPLKPGYAPFCKHIFMPNFIPGLPDGVLAVTEENQSLLQTAYVARTEKELPVLTRWFPKKAVADRTAEAAYLDVILYSREQIRKENAAKGNTDDTGAPWGIVSIKPQGIDTEIPMEPITMMRNALGRDQGGSGVDLDRDAYARSADFWGRHARVQ